MPCMSLVNVMVAGLGSTSDIILYGYAEWNKTKKVTRRVFDTFDVKVTIIIALTNT